MEISRQNDQNSNFLIKIFSKPQSLKQNKNPTDSKKEATEDLNKYSKFH